MLIEWFNIVGHQQGKCHVIRISLSHSIVKDLLTCGIFKYIYKNMQLYFAALKFSFYLDAQIQNQYKGQKVK